MNSRLSKIGSVHIYVCMLYPAYPVRFILIEYVDVVFWIHIIRRDLYNQVQNFKQEEQKLQLINS